MPDKVHENVDHFELAYAPESYGLFDPALDGIWYSISADGEKLGTIWTDGTEGLGFILNPSTKASSEMQSRIPQLLDRFKRMNVPASTAYEAFKLIDGFTVESDMHGLLEEITQNPVTAAAAPDNTDTQLKRPTSGPGASIPVDTEGLDPADLPEYSFIAVDADNNVVGAGRSTHETLLMRDNGAWVPLPEDDLRYDGCEWLEVSDDVIDEYDNRINAGLEFLRDDVENPIV